MEMIGKYEVSRVYGLVWATFATYMGMTLMVALNPNARLTEEVIDKVFAKVLDSRFPQSFLGL